MAKKNGVENAKRAMDRRFLEIFEDLMRRKKISSVRGFAKELDIPHANNLHAIFRSAQGHENAVRHLNDYLISKLVQVYDVNEEYIMFGKPPMYTKAVRTVMPKFNSPLEAIRNTHKLTQNEMANILGVQQPYVSAVENNRLPLSIEMIKTLKREFNVPYDFLLDYTGDTSLLYDAMKKKKKK